LTYSTIVLLMNTSLLIVFALIITVQFIVILVLKLKPSNSQRENQLESLFEKSERNNRQEFSFIREEISKNSKQQRDDNLNQFKTFSELITKYIADIGRTQNMQLDTFAAQLKSYQQLAASADALNRDELKKSFLSFEENFSKNMKSFNELLREKMEASVVVQNEINKTIEVRLDKMRETIEIRLKNLQDEYSKKMEEMRNIVDEKLQTTLDKRLTESFKQVSERLELVHKGLGEMQILANGVGDLKKVLSNVKTRGVFGEVQLGNILEQILTKDQYDINVATKKGSRENVEFAIKLPGKDDDGKVVYLPIDSKFPLEDYYSLMEAYDNGDSATIQNCIKLLENNIKRVAKDIRDKYIDPPHTTEFGIMFLPTEGLYAEIVRRTNLLEILQREYKIVVTGPTTLAAILNSLQMGFRTLAIEKRSSEVWKILSAVKTEFSKFNDVLKKAQEKINKASEDIDNLVGTRTRQIQIKLKNVTIMPPSESAILLSDETDIEPTGEE